MNSQQKKIIFIVLKLASSVALLLWVIRKTELSEIVRALKGANIYFLVGAFIIYCGSYYLRTYRWQILLKTKGVKASNTYLYQSYLVSIFFSNFLPSIVGGDAIRIYDVWRLEPNKSIAVSTVVVDRLLGLIVLIAFAAGGILFVPRVNNILELSPYDSWIGFGILIITIIIQQVFLPLKKIIRIVNKTNLFKRYGIAEKISNLLEGFRSFSKQALFQALSWSVLIQIAVIVHYYLIAKALNFPTSLITFFFIVPIATFIMMLPISINAIGLRENTFIFLLGTFSRVTSRADTIAFSWLAYGIIVTLGLIGGIVHMLKKYN